jgi:putative tryptophan/tyrosine transport system substrate-binding protein
MIRRRGFIAGLSGAAAWPLAARAQQGERTRRIGVLMNLAADDPDGPPRITAFAQGLQEAGWALGRNVRIDYRWSVDSIERSRMAAELVALGPDVLMASGAVALYPLLQTTHTVPIVFAAVIDPVANGVVESLARPGGNATGFIAFEISMGAKWLELLKQIAPNVKRVAVIRTVGGANGIGQLAAIQTAAPSFGVEVTPVGTGSAGEIERGLTAFARAPNGGVVVTVSAPSQAHRALITGLAARHKLPAVYPYRMFATAGGLMSYGPDPIDQYRRAAGYVDRILKGEKPADLPVQAPTKYETVLNIKTAKALGLTIPETLLATADEVIQ